MRQQTQNSLGCDSCLAAEVVTTETFLQKTSNLRDCGFVLTARRVILYVMEEGFTELVFVLTMMFFLIIICIVAVYLFIRQWRLEHPKQKSEKTEE